MYWILFGIVLFLLITFAQAGKSLAPWLPAKKQDLQEINASLNLKEGQKFIELGSGDGRVSIYIAQKNPKAGIVGIEYFLPLFIWSYVKSKILGIKNITFIYGDIYKHNVSSYDVIYVFGMIESLNDRLIKKFESELKKSARIISYVFSIQGVQNKSWLHQLESKKERIYIYEKITTK